MWKAGVIAIAALGTAVPATAAADVVDTITVRGSAQVTPGETRTLILTCPQPAVALHGATTREPGSDSIPNSNPRRWTFKLRGGPGRARAILRCVALELPPGVLGVTLTVGTVRRPDLFVVAGATRSVTLTCQRGMVPTGWGIERGADGRTIAVAAAIPTTRGFRFRLENTGSGGGSVTPRVRCLKRTQRADTGETHSFKTRIGRWGNTGTSAHHVCRTNEFSLATGVALDPADDILLRSAMPERKRGGRWSFNSGGESRTSLVCLNRGTAF